VRIPSLIWKPGVIAYGQEARRKVEREKRREGSWQFSYRLLKTLQNQFASEDEELLERLFSSMQAGEGVYKITKRNRFEELDLRILKEASQLRGPGRLAMHDGACSSAITSLEFWHRLRSLGDWTLTASDYFTHLWLVEQDGWTVALDQLGTPIQITGARTVISPSAPISILLPINHLLRTYAKRVIVPRAVERWTKNQSASQLDASIARIPLFHPAAIKEAGLAQGFRLSEHNLFEPLAEKVNILRVMNFLTPNHLSPEKISAAFEAMRQSLATEGLLVVGRTRDESDGALLTTAYRKLANGHLAKLWEMDGPWECEKQATSLAAA
jgi:hypothetical protein